MYASIWIFSSSSRRFPPKEWNRYLEDNSSTDERSHLLTRMEARPYEFAGQELLNLSTIPVWSENGLRPRRVVLRVYLAAVGTRWVVMPGGLARVSASSIHRSSRCSAGVAARIPGFYPKGRSIALRCGARAPAGRGESRRYKCLAQPCRGPYLLARAICRARREPGACSALHPHACQ